MSKERSIDQSSYSKGEAGQDIALTPVEREFVKDSKNVISGHLARTVLIASAVLAGAGIVAEKSGSFDLLPNPVDSANHLVLKGLDKSYDQLIDKLPEVKDAEANPVLYTIETNLTNRPAGAIGGVAYFDFDYTTHLVTNSFKNAIDWHCYPVGPNRVPPNDSDKFTCGVCPANSNRPPHVGEALKIYFFNTGLNLHITAQDWGPRPSGGGAEAGEGSAAGSGSCSVGGIAQQPDVEALPQDITSEPQDITSEKSKDYTTPIAVGIAGAVVAAVAATGAALHIRRNRPAK